MGGGELPVVADVTVVELGLDDVRLIESLISGIWRKTIGRTLIINYPAKNFGHLNNKVVQASEIGVLQDVVFLSSRIDVRFSMADLRFPTKNQVGQGICLFVLICLAYGLIWEVPRRQVDVSRDRLTAKEAIDAETAARTGWSQLLVGSFVAFGAFTTWKNLQENQNKNRDDARNAEKNLQVLLEKNTADRFSKAIEQLGNEDSIHVRLGGIFALEQIANTEDKYYWQIMEILTAYVRERSPWPLKNVDDTAIIIPVTADIQAVMTVIARRRKSYQCGEPSRLDLTKTNLQELIVKPEANFRGVGTSPTSRLATP